jgi:hypothetical protein
MSTPDLFNQLLRTTEAIGVEKTFTVLKEAEFQEIKFDNEHAEFVITEVAKAFGVPIHEIIYGNGRKNERKYAIGFSAYYLHHEYGYHMDNQVKDFLKKDITLCHKYCKLINKLNPRHIHDQRYIEIKDKLDPIFKKK